MKIIISNNLLGMIKKRFDAISPYLDERQRRLFAANETIVYGEGGVRNVAKVLGMSTTTISKGIRELHRGEPDSPLKWTWEEGSSARYGKAGQIIQKHFDFQWINLGKYRSMRKNLRFGMLCVARVGHKVVSTKYGRNSTLYFHGSVTPINYYKNSTWINCRENVGSKVTHVHQIYTNNKTTDV